MSRIAWKLNCGYVMSRLTTETRALPALVRWQDVLNWTLRTISATMSPEKMLVRSPALTEQMRVKVPQEE